MWPPLSLVAAGCVLVYLSTVSYRSVTSYLKTGSWSHDSAGANEQWQRIWKAKGVKIPDDMPLHHANGFNAINLEQWDLLIATIVKAEGRTQQRFRPNDSVIDFGCGAGAFLQSLGKLEPSLDLFGLDYSAPLVDLARERVGPTGHFWRGDVRNVGFIPDEEFNHAVSFSVFQYLDTYSDVLKAWGEMARVTKLQGSVVVFEVSDKDRKADAIKLRSESDYEKKKLATKKAAVTPDHLFTPKSLFQEHADKLGLRVDAIIDERAMQPDLSFYEPSEYRYVVYATKIRNPED